MSKTSTGTGASPPRLPEGLRDIMKSFTKEILREKPQNIYKFAAQYFESKLNESNQFTVKGYEAPELYTTLLNNSKRNQIPSSLVFAIIPEKITQFIKDFIKAVIKENPANICHFAVQYFGQLQVTASDTENEEIVVEYTEYENYLKNKRSLIYTPYIKCSCGRILGKISSTDNMSQHKDAYDSSLHLKYDIKDDKNHIQTPSKGLTQRNGVPTKVAKSIQKESKSHSNDYDKYINSVHILQRFFRRCLTKKTINMKSLIVKTKKSKSYIHTTNSMSEETAAMIIQRTIRKLFNTTTPTILSTTSPVYIVPKLDISQRDEQSDNVSEAASYTSASTVLMSADSLGENADHAINPEESIIHNTIIEDEEVENDFEFPNASQESGVSTTKLSELYTSINLNKKSILNINEGHQNSNQQNNFIFNKPTQKVEEKEEDGLENASQEDKVIISDEFENVSQDFKHEEKLSTNCIIDDKQRNHTQIKKPATTSEQIKSENIDSDMSVISRLDNSSGKVLLKDELQTTDELTKDAVNLQNNNEVKQHFFDSKPAKIENTELNCTGKHHPTAFDSEINIYTDVTPKHGHNLEKVSTKDKNTISSKREISPDLLGNNILTKDNVLDMKPDEALETELNRTEMNKVHVEKDLKLLENNDTHINNSDDVTQKLITTLENESSPVDLDSSKKDLQILETNNILRNPPNTAEDAKKDVIETENKVSRLQNTLENVSSTVERNIPNKVEKDSEFVENYDLVKGYTYGTNQGENQDTDIKFTDMTNPTTTSESNIKQESKFETNGSALEKRSSKIELITSNTTEPNSEILQLNNTVNTYSLDTDGFRNDDDDKSELETILHKVSTKVDSNIPDKSEMEADRPLLRSARTDITHTRIEKPTSTSEVKKNEKIKSTMNGSSDVAPNFISSLETSSKVDDTTNKLQERDNNLKHPDIIKPTSTTDDNKNEDIDISQLDGIKNLEKTLNKVSSKLNLNTEDKLQKDSEQTENKEAVNVETCTTKYLETKDDNRSNDPKNSEIDQPTPKSEEKNGEEHYSKNNVCSEDASTLEIIRNHNIEKNDPEINDSIGGIQKFEKFEKDLSKVQLDIAHHSENKSELLENNDTVTNDGEINTSTNEIQNVECDLETILSQIDLKKLIRSENDAEILETTDIKKYSIDSPPDGSDVVDSKHTEINKHFTTSDGKMDEDADTGSNVTNDLTLKSETPLEKLPSNVKLNTAENLIQNSEIFEDEQVVKLESSVTKSAKTVDNDDQKYADIDKSTTTSEEKNVCSKITTTLESSIEKVSSKVGLNTSDKSEEDSEVFKSHDIAKNESEMDESTDETHKVENSWEKDLSKLDLSKLNKSENDAEILETTDIKKYSIDSPPDGSDVVDSKHTEINKHFTTSDGKMDEDADTGSNVTNDLTLKSETPLEKLPSNVKLNTAENLIQNSEIFEDEQVVKLESSVRKSTNTVDSNDHKYAGVDKSTTTSEEKNFCSEIAATLKSSIEKVSSKVGLNNSDKSEEDSEVFKSHDIAKNESEMDESTDGTHKVENSWEKDLSKLDLSKLNKSENDAEILETSDIKKYSIDSKHTEISKHSTTSDGKMDEDTDTGSNVTKDLTLKSQTPLETLPSNVKLNTAENLIQNSEIFEDEQVVKLESSVTKSAKTVDNDDQKYADIDKSTTTCEEKNVCSEITTTLESSIEKVSSKVGLNTSDKSEEDSEVFKSHDIAKNESEMDESTDETHKVENSWEKDLSKLDLSKLNKSENDAEILETTDIKKYSIDSPPDGSDVVDSKHTEINKHFTTSDGKMDEDADTGSNVTKDLTLKSQTPLETLPSNVKLNTAENLIQNSEIFEDEQVVKLESSVTKSAKTVDNDDQKYADIDKSTTTCEEKNVCSEITTTLESSIEKVSSKVGLNTSDKSEEDSEVFKSHDIAKNESEMDESTDETHKVENSWEKDLSKLDLSKLNKSENDAEILETTDIKKYSIDSPPDGSDVVDSKHTEINKHFTTSDGKMDEDADTGSNVTNDLTLKSETPLEKLPSNVKLNTAENLIQNSEIFEDEQVVKLESSVTKSAKTVDNDDQKYADIDKSTTTSEEKNVCSKITTTLESSIEKVSSKVGLNTSDKSEEDSEVFKSHDIAKNESEMDESTDGTHKVENSWEKDLSKLDLSKLNKSENDAEILETSDIKKYSIDSKHTEISKHSTTSDGKMDEDTDTGSNVTKDLTLKSQTPLETLPSNVKLNTAENLIQNSEIFEDEQVVKLESSVTKSAKTVDNDDQKYADIDKSTTTCEKKNVCSEITTTLESSIEKVSSKVGLNTSDKSEEDSEVFKSHDIAKNESEMDESTDETHKVENSWEKDLSKLDLSKLNKSENDAEILETTDIKKYSIDSPPDGSDVVDSKHTEINKHFTTSDGKMDEDADTGSNVTKDLTLKSQTPLETLPSNVKLNTAENLIQNSEIFEDEQVVKLESSVTKSAKTVDNDDQKYADIDKSTTTCEEKNVCSEITTTLESSIEKVSSKVGLNTSDKSEEDSEVFKSHDIAKNESEMDESTDETHKVENSWEKDLSKLDLSKLNKSENDAEILETTDIKKYSIDSPPDGSDVVDCKHTEINKHFTTSDGKMDEDADTGSNVTNDLTLKSETPLEKLPSNVKLNTAENLIQNSEIFEDEQVVKLESSVTKSAKTVDNDDQKYADIDKSTTTSEEKNVCSEIAATLKSSIEKVSSKVGLNTSDKSEDSEVSKSNNITKNEYENNDSFDRTQKSNTKEVTVNILTGIINENIISEESPTIKSSSIGMKRGLPEDDFYPKNEPKSALELLQTDEENNNSIVVNETTISGISKIEACNFKMDTGEDVTNVNNIHTTPADGIIDGVSSQNLHKENFNPNDNSGVDLEREHIQYGNLTKTLSATEDTSGLSSSISKRTNDKENIEICNITSPSTIGSQNSHASRESSNDKCKSVHTHNNINKVQSKISNVDRKICTEKYVGLPIAEIHLKSFKAINALEAFPWFDPRKDKHLENNVVAEPSTSEHQLSNIIELVAKDKNEDAEKEPEMAAVAALKNNFGNAKSSNQTYENNKSEQQKNCNPDCFTAKELESNIVTISKIDKKIEISDEDTIDKENESVCTTDVLTHIPSKNTERTATYLYGVYSQPDIQNLPQIYNKKFTSFTIPFNSQETKLKRNPKIQIYETHNDDNENNISEITCEDDSCQSIQSKAHYSDKKRENIRLNLDGKDEKEPELDLETPTELFAELIAFDYFSNEIPEELTKYELDRTYTVEEVGKINYFLNQDCNQLQEVNALENDDDESSSSDESTILSSIKLHTIIELNETQNPCSNEYKQLYDDNHLQEEDSPKSSTGQNIVPVKMSVVDQNLEMPAHNINLENEAITTDKGHLMISPLQPNLESMKRQKSIPNQNQLGSNVQDKILHSTDEMKKKSYLAASPLRYSKEQIAETDIESESQFNNISQSKVLQNKEDNSYLKEAPLSEKECFSAESLAFSDIFELTQATIVIQKYFRGYLSRRKFVTNVTKPQFHKFERSFNEKENVEGLAASIIQNAYSDYIKRQQRTTHHSILSNKSSELLTATKIRNDDIINNSLNLINDDENVESNSNNTIRNETNNVNSSPPLPSDVEVPDLQRTKVNWFVGNEPIITPTNSRSAHEDAFVDLSNITNNFSTKEPHSSTNNLEEVCSSTVLAPSITSNIGSKQSATVDNSSKYFGIDNIYSDDKLISISNNSDDTVPVDCRELKAVEAGPQNIEKILVCASDITKTYNADINQKMQSSEIHYREAISDRTSTDVFNSDITKTNIVDKHQKMQFSETQDHEAISASTSTDQKHKLGKSKSTDNNVKPLKYSNIRQNNNSTSRPVTPDVLKMVTQFIRNEREYSLPKERINIHTNSENKLKDKQPYLDTNIPYEIFEQPCIKKTVSVSDFEVGEKSSESRVDSNNMEGLEPEDTSPDSSLDTITEQMQKTNAVIDRMAKRRASEVLVAEVKHFEASAFEEPDIRAIQEHEHEDDDIVVLKRLQSEDLRESSAESESVIFGTDLNVSTEGIGDNFEASPTFKGALKRLYTIAGDGKTLFKSVTIDDTVKYIESSKGSFYLDDDTTTNIRRKMLACSLSEGEFDSNEISDLGQLADGSDDQYRNVGHDDFNISTALVDTAETSTDTESTIISAATKIQAGARGFLARKRLRCASGGTNLSVQNDTKASFGNEAISESLEKLVEDVAAKKIQNAYRKHYRKKMKENIDKKETKNVSDSLNDPSENTLSAKRLTLQRGDALRNYSTPDEENGSNENLKLEVRVIPIESSVKVIPSPSTFTITHLENTSTTRTVTSHMRNKYTNNEERKKLKWPAMRQYSMPVQIESEIFRVIPKHKRKRIRSAETDKKGKTSNYKD